MEAADRRDEEYLERKRDTHTHVRAGFVVVMIHIVQTLRHRQTGRHRQVDRRGGRGVG